MWTRWGFAFRRSIAKEAEVTPRVSEKTGYLPLQYPTIEMTYADDLRLSLDIHINIKNATRSSTSAPGLLLLKGVLGVYVLVRKIENVRDCGGRKKRYYKSRSHTHGSF